MKVLLLGLGRANIAVARFLVERGNDVVLYEEHKEEMISEAKSLLATGQVKEYANERVDLVISSPGFPPSKKIIKMMEEKNAPVIDEIEFTFRHLTQPRIVAVTGTNGKSTTAALIHTIAESAGKKVFLGGNISPGIPFSQSLFLPPSDYYILEVSSFQLMRVQSFHPWIAVLTNISRDHLNWHSSFEEYQKAKARIFENQTPDDFAVLNSEDDHVRSCTDMISAHRVYFGSRALTGVHFDGHFHYRGDVLFPVTISRLEGVHNIGNIAAAIAVAKVLGIDNDVIERGVRSFRTLPHRLEDIGSLKGIRYVNNSMCTNAEAAIASFKAITGSKIVVVGGSQKGDSGDEYLALLVKEAKACVVLGENADYIARYFEGKHYRNSAVARDMNDAVTKARSFADPGDTIMLNPGYASFGNFRDFEERGEAFKGAARKN